MKMNALPNVDFMFKAVSDKTRLRILHLLRDGEICVCDLVGVLSVPQPTASRHLAYLRRAGLVVARKDGLWSYYKLARAGSAFHTKLLECLVSIPMPEFAADAKRLAARRKLNCC